MLETTRLKLVRISYQDNENMKELYMNEYVRKYLGGPCQEKHVEKSFAKMLLSHSNEKHLTIIEKHSNQFIGLLSLNQHHDGMATELSYQLLPEWWGKGYGCEAVTAMIAYAFNELNLPQVVAETQTANQASCALLEKVGMHVKEKVYRFGNEQVIYLINKQEINEK